MKSYLIFVVIGVISTVMISTTFVYAQEEGNTTDNVPEFFTIQHAQSGLIYVINETTYSLELNDVSDKTILFADRPDRFVMYETTTNFIENWSVGKDSFAVNAPNAGIIVNNNEGQQNTAIIELFDPIYDPDKRTLKYDVTTDNSTSIELPSEFRQTTMVIDVCRDKGPCGGD